MHFDYKDSNINSFGNEGDSYYPWSADSDSKSAADHYNMRRARIGIKGRIGGIADYLLLANIQGSSILDEGYIDVNKFEPLGIKFGKFKQPMNLEIMTSSNNIDFIERSYLSQNLPEKKFGVGLHGELNGITYFGSMFQNNDNALSQKDEDMSFAGRGTVNFAEIMGNKDLVAHFGLNGYTSSYEVQPSTSGNTSGGEEQQTRATIYSYTSGGAGLQNMIRGQIGGEPLCGTGSSINTCSSTSAYHTNSPSTAHVNNKKGGLEAAIAYNNFKVQGEYGQARYEANVAGGLLPGTIDSSLKTDIDTWYIEALWTLTGEKYASAYKKGAFGLVKPDKEFNFDKATGLGLWEIGLRVDEVSLSESQITSSKGGTTNDYTRVQGSVVKGSSIDSCNVLTTGGCTGGGATSYTAGIKWVLNPNFLVKANYTYTDFDQPFAPIDIGTKSTSSGRATAANMKLIDHEDLIMIRGQYMF
jgi:phosphate-selective porin OprO/OprP